MSAIKSSIRFRAFPQAPKPAAQDNAGKGQVEQHDVRISSFVQPSIKTGTYEINVVQHIRTPDSSTDEAPLTSKKIFTVQAPKFKLSLADDIHSVYPAPGHSDYGNTLAHVVFSDPTTPWERPMRDIEDVDKFNKTPWVAVLTFTEDELKMPQADIDRSIKSRQGNTFTTATTAGNIAGLKAGGIVTPLDAPNFTSDFKDTDLVDLLPLPIKLFKSLFVKYSNGKADTWTGKPDTSRYASVAHIRDIHGGDMASTTQGESERSHAVVISHRTAPIGLPAPTNVISHLVSLEGIDGMDVPDGCPYQYVGLVSLYSWNWMAVPPEHADFIHTMDKLSKNIQPLRMKDEFIAKIVADGKTPSEAEAKLLQRIKDGYLLKQRTLTTGEKTMSFFRGPLCPNVISDSLIKPWSLYGTDLQILDGNTGIVDISYAVAWNLGFSQAIGDPAFSTSLLRLRGKIHSQALLRAKEKVDSSYKNLPEYLQQLKTAVDHLASTGKPDETASAEALRRWHITSPMNSEDEGAQRLSLEFSPVLQQYLDQIAEITKTLTSARDDNKLADGGVPYNELNDPVDHDWAYVLGWLLDRLFAAKLPLHYLIPDPESLPRESIRTFFIDPTWLECVIDGALSIANHFEKSDDSIRRQLKEAINTYLSSPLAPGQLPQMPKWGFLMRSIAVSSFPDLKVDAPFPAGKESSQSKMLLMQRLSEDVLLCLFDRCPDDDNFGSIVFSQPAHQQSFACGDFLDAESLELAFRFIPNVSGATIASLTVKSKTVKWKRGDTSVSPVYDWDSRCVIVPSFAKWCIETLKQPGFFEWDQASRGIPSSLICSQLSKAVFRLTLTSPTTNTTIAKSGPRQLFVPPRRSVPEHTPSKTNANSQPAVIPKVTLPVGNRPQPQRPEVEAKATDTALKPADVPRYIYPPYPDSDGFDGTETTQFQYTPRIYPLQNPKDKEKATILDNFGRPQDLLFEIQTRTESAGVPWNPRQFEWLIPVRLASLGTPVDPAIASLPAMLEVGGSIDFPDLPKVEPVNRGCRWLYDTRLLYGPLLKGQGSGRRCKYVIEDETTHLQALLIIRARSREKYELWSDHNLQKPVDATFLLKRVRVAKLSDVEKAAGRDVPYSIVSLPAVESATQPVMAQSFSLKISSS